VTPFMVMTSNQIDQKIYPLCAHLSDEQNKKKNTQIDKKLAEILNF